MEKTRYFRSANRFNVFVNSLSGNFFPLSKEKLNVTFFMVLWVIFVWTLRITYFFIVMLGSLYFANITIQAALKGLGAVLAVCVELMLPAIYFNLRRNDLRNLIKKYNDVLVDSDELRNLVLETIEPYQKGLKFYITTCVISNVFWSATPILSMFDTDQFTYDDYVPPAYYPGAPFSRNFFLAGVMWQVLASSFISLGKISADIYISHFIAVLSAEYKYIRTQMARALSRENDQEDEASVIRSLRKCIEHHGAVIGIGQSLAEILALQIGATYITCIMKFCFLAFGVITFESANIEKVAFVAYTLGCVLQIFLLCSCVQELLDVSTSVTEDAFYENWHGRSPTVKKMFCLVETGAQMECRLSAYRIVDLVVPTMAVILSKSYSVCLLLLEVN